MERYWNENDDILIHVQPIVILRRAVWPLPFIHLSKSPSFKYAFFFLHHGYDVYSYSDTLHNVHNPVSIYLYTYTILLFGFSFFG